jgi:hypothetical protein
MFMALLMGFMALAIDVGILFRARRAVQSATDAAAVAAAMDYKFNQNVTMAQNAGRAASAANGYTNGTAGVVVNVTRQTAGPYAGCSGCFEATVMSPNPTFFMRMFNFSSIDVGARAVAGRGSWENCMILLGTSGADFNNSGAGTMSMPNCGFVDNSSSSNAFRNSGALTLTAQSIGIVGQVSNGGSETLTPTAVTGISPSGDPLGLSAPSIAGCGAAQNISVNKTLSPGCYNGLTTNGSANVTLNPGLYVINGNIQMNGAQTLSGTGVTIFFNGAVTLNGAATIRLSAPTSGTWNGILLFESPGDSNTVALNGAAASNLQGIVYMPSGTLDIGGASSMSLYAVFVVDRLMNSGAISLTNNDYLIKNPNSPLAAVTLLE